MPPQRERPTGAVWVADWSDDEHAAVTAAAARVAARVGPVRVVRGLALGGTVGTRGHRLRSYPTYLLLALRGLVAARGGHLVAWQPLAGAVAALLAPVLPARLRPRVTVCNPILTAGADSAVARLVAAGLRRADRVVVYSEAARAPVVAVGVERHRVQVVLLGVAERPAAGVGGGYFLAAGRDHRDWATLAAAARGLAHPVRVAGPDAVPGPLELVRPGGRAEFLELLAGARALVVPLLSADRPAGQLAVLDALSVGVPVVATDGQGMGDYLDEGCGRLVPVADVAALAAALAGLDVDAPLAELAEAAHARARSRHSWERFVADVTLGHGDSA